MGFLLFFEHILCDAVNGKCYNVSQRWIKATQKCVLSYHVYNTCCENKYNLLT